MPTSATITSQPNVEPGTVISGTHRPQDLIPKFLSYWNHTKKTLAEYNYAQGLDDDDPWWTSDMAGWLLEDLFHEMDEIAPPDHYFGAHPGNGSDFGFWELDDEP